MVTVPNALSLIRLLLVPVLLTLAWNGHRKIFLNVLLVSLLTDALDGWLARKLKQTSELGARLDSWADMLTALSLPFAGWWLRPDVVRQESLFLALGIGFYLLAPACGWLKFRRLPCYHTWLSKTAAVVFAIVVIVIFAGGPGWPLRISMPLVMLACVEEIFITTLLKTWRPNVPTCWHAMQSQRRAGP
jgi:CDP-diacylglycerol--glycerol-3-phosphate 3-phosphatidyltransferase